MVKLDDATVYRGGVTAKTLDYETKDCSFEYNRYRKTVEFRFRIASKGGGDTSILLRIGEKDIPKILQPIAENNPKMLPAFVRQLSLLLSKLVVQTNTLKDNQLKLQNSWNKLRDDVSFMEGSLKKLPKSRLIGRLIGGIIDEIGRTTDLVVGTSKHITSIDERMNTLWEQFLKFEEKLKEKT